MLSRSDIQRIKEKYPTGSRIELNAMDDPYNPVPPGTRGTVKGVDDAGDIMMHWDNGRSLSLVPGEDSFRLLTPQEISEEKGMIEDINVVIKEAKEKSNDGGNNMKDKINEKENTSRVEKYPVLIGHGESGTKELHGIKEVAEFICREGLKGDVLITQPDGKHFLNTFGPFIDRIEDQEYRGELLDVLIPMQQRLADFAIE